MNADIIASQLPLSHDYIEGARAWWNTSRHPDAIREIVATGMESSKELTLLDKAVVLGTAALEVIELSPLNETIIAKVGGTVLSNTGNINQTVAAVGLTTAALELSLGLGMAYSVNKLESSVKTFQKNYLVDSIVENNTNEKKSKLKKASILGSVAWASGSGGAMLYTESHEINRTSADRVKTAVKVAGMLALYDAGITFILTKGASTLEDLGVNNATRELGNYAKNPLIVLGIIGGIVGTANWKQNRALRKKIEHEQQENASITLLPVKNKNRKITHFLQRLHRSKQISGVQ